MRRSLALLVAVLLAAPAAAAAQAPTPTPALGVLTLPAPDEGDDGVLDPGELPPADEPSPAPQACAPEDGTGADADYGYCSPCPDAGSDGDYAYCAAAGAGRDEDVLPAHAEVHQVPAGALPYTGSEPLLV